MIITKSKKKDINNKNTTKDSDICYLVPELCNLTVLTKAMKNNHYLMEDIQKYTFVSAEVQQYAKTDLVNHINDLVKMEGPVYKNESILLSNNIRINLGSKNKMNWQIDVAKNAMFVTVNVLNWVIMYNQRDESTAKSFC